LRDGMHAQADDGQRKLAREAALGLLERSVRMRHRRLAVQRLHDAISSGAQVPGEHWTYCGEAAANSDDVKVRSLFALSEEFLRATQSGIPSTVPIPNALGRALAAQEPARLYNYQSEHHE